MRRLRIFADESGASIVEMGLAAPILATMLIGMIDLSYAYSHKLQLEQAAQRTIEKVQISSFKTTDMPGLKTEAETAAGTGSTAMVTVWLECNGTKKAFTDSCNTGEAYARYVSVEVARNYDPFFPWRWAGANSNGTVTLEGRAGIRVQ